MMDEKGLICHSLLEYGFKSGKSGNVRFNAFSTVWFRANSYSVSVQYA